MGGTEQQTATVEQRLDEAADALRKRDAMSISFSGEASDAMPDRIEMMKGWYVRITPREGDPFDAHIIGPASDERIENDYWNDAVRYVDVDTSTGLPLDGAARKVVRFVDIYVY